MDIKNSLYVEKYRPNKLDEFIGNSDVMVRFANYIKNKDAPHLLLYGRAGTGKTTLAKLLVSEIGADKLYINASDENDIETVRTKIKRFAMSASINNNLKFIILDEADYLTPNAQAALRSLMESVSHITRFILTANYQSRIIEALVSRCTSFEIRPLSKPMVAARIDHILKTEGIKYDVKDFVPIINSYFPDLRKIINEIQRCVIGNKLVVDSETIKHSDYRLQVLEVLKDKKEKKKFEVIRKLVLNNQVKDFSDMYSLIYENLDDITDDPGQAILIIAEQQFRDSLVVDKEITFCACIVRLLEVI